MELQLIGIFTLHVIRIVCTMMIYSGIVGFSSGDNAEGIDLGDVFLDYAPSNLFPFDRSPVPRGWIDGWWDPGYGALTQMMSKGWFDTTSDLHR